MHGTSFKWLKKKNVTATDQLKQDNVLILAVVCVNLLYLVKYM